MIENTDINYKNTIFIGANFKTQHLIKQVRNGELEYNPISIFDDVDDETYISNVKVKKLEKLDLIKNIDTAIITKELSQKELDTLTDKLTKLGIKEIKIYKQFEDKLKDISIEDLLAREPKDIDTKEIAKFIKDKIVLVTGAGGSIGSEIVRQCDKFGAKKIIMVDKCEYNLYKISNEVKGENVLCSVNSPLFEEVFKNNKIDILIHASAYKHVPLCEENPKSCIYNNVFGSIRVIDLAIKYKVKKVVNISTDKAVRPTNIMGASKRVVELYAKNVPSKETEIVSVRFGNVLGSSGSVVPLFKEKIANNENLPVTHPEITRYFMLIPEACSLVLQAASIAKGGELFILDMGEAVKIKDLAQKMIDLSGKNLKIEYIGLRPGEKLYEELLISKDDLKTKYESIFIVNEKKIDFNQLKEKIIKLKDDISILKQIVEYQGEC
jgi:UDP-N-acetyl-D-glucosamine 4,6-dehydratase